MAMRKRPSVDSWISKSWHSLSQPAGWSRLTSLLVKHFVGRQDILNMIVAITSFTITSHIQARSHPLPPGRPLLWPCTQVFERNVQQKVLIKIHWVYNVFLRGGLKVMFLSKRNGRSSLHSSGSTSTTTALWEMNWCQITSTKNKLINGKVNKE